MCRFNEMQCAGALTIFPVRARAGSSGRTRGRGRGESLRALTVNLFKLRAMFHRVQQLLLPRHNRNRAKRAGTESMACSGSPVYKAGRKAERWIASWDDRHRNHLRSACLSLLHRSFPSFFSLASLSVSPAFSPLLRSALRLLKRTTPVRTRSSMTTGFGRLRTQQQRQWTGWES